MHKLDLRGRLLYLNGINQTLKLTQLHNTRNIPIELKAFCSIPRQADIPKVLFSACAR